MKKLVATIFLLAVFASPAVAQQRPQLLPGEWVRDWLPQFIDIYSRTLKTVRDKIAAEERYEKLRAECFTVGYWNKYGRNLESQIGPKVFHWINGWWWGETGNKYVYDPVKFAAHVATLEIESEIIMLDVEGEVIQTMRSPTNPRRDEVLGWYIDALEVIRAKFPQKKIGVYAVPWLPFWWNEVTGPALMERQREVMAALKPHVDIFNPSIYDFYKDDDGTGISNHPNGTNLIIPPEMAKTHVERLTRLALEGAGQEVAVMPAIWRLYHNGNRVFGYSLIPIGEFTLHIGYANAVEVDGDRIDGFLFWNRQWVNTMELGGVPPAPLPATATDAEKSAWLDHTEAESYNAVAEMIGLDSVRIPPNPFDPVHPRIGPPVGRVTTPVIPPERRPLAKGKPITDAP